MKKGRNVQLTDMAWLGNLTFLEILHCTSVH